MTLANGRTTGRVTRATEGDVADTGGGTPIESEMQRAAHLSLTGERPLQLLGGDHVRLAVRSLGRSIAFYRRVFGFRILDDSRQHPHPCVIMAASGHTRLFLQELPQLRDATMADANASRVCRWRFLVGDLTEARASLWDLGVPLAAGSREPDGPPQGQRQRAVLVQDPDGHRIELLETPRGGPGSP